MNYFILAVDCFACPFIYFWFQVLLKELIIIEILELH